MPHHCETRILPYSPTQVFDLVADIEAYPDFLPWCEAAQIIETKDDLVVADLVVGGSFFSDRFCSHVKLNRPGNISVTYGGGALQHLATEWCFADALEGQCAVTFTVDFEIRSHLLGRLMDSFFDKAFLTMVGAFEARAVVLYDKKASQICGHRM